uniref:SMC domain-containing protein (SbcC) n=1 Tax=uncultured marine thaumarchaeote KM3_198_G09 TaxID=1456089 RepID=A0A075GXP5_9ARCH|nr:SMC domain-containing protein (sbcC) [uncultured marine thaumarchaeote KM3_198_G09]
MIRNIELVDFLAHSNTKLEFENDATVFVGDNGAGKSNIIDAITFSLFGEHTRKNNKGLIRRGANQGFAKIEFSANGKNYQAVRKIDSKGTLTAQFAEDMDGKLVPIAEGERKQFGESMTKHVEGTLGMDFEKLKIASIVQQGELSSIIKAKPKEFKELLNTIIGIDKLDAALTSMRTVQREFRSTIQKKFGYDDTQVELLENKIAEYQNESKNAQPRLEQLDVEKREQELLIAKLENQIQNDSTKESQLKDLESRKKEWQEYAKDVIKSIQNEVAEKEEIVNECKPCFAISKNKNEIESEINKIQKKLSAIESELNDLEKKQVRLEEHEELAEKLVLKDGKCPVCDSTVDHLKPLFQKKHIEDEIKEIEKKIEKLENEKEGLEQNDVSLTNDLEEIKKAETILSTHKIKNESQLDEISAEIKAKVKQMQKIPLTIIPGQLVGVANLDSHAKTIYESIVSLEKSTSGFDQQELQKNIESRADSMTRLTQINQEYGEISGNIKKAKIELEKLGSTLTELKHVERYVTELENIQENVYNRDGPVGKSLRSWSLEIISQKASEYLEKLNTKIQRISLSEKTRDVNISCYSRNTTLDIESLSGGEQVSVALALRLGMSHLLGASNLNFMILDEPTAHLDGERRKSLVNVLSQLTSLKEDSSMQFIIITHDAEIFDDSSVENIYKFESNPNGTIVSRL